MKEQVADSAGTEAPGEAGEAHPAPVDPKPVWNAVAGRSLRANIEAWAATHGWAVRWEADDLDYPIDVGFEIEGSWEEALTVIFDLYRSAPRPFSTTLYAPQKLIVVMEKR